MVDLVKCGCGGTPSKPREVDKGDERRGYNFKAEITCTKCGIKAFGDSARDDLGWCNDTGQAIEDAVEKWNTALRNNCVAERDALKAELSMEQNRRELAEEEIEALHLNFDGLGLPRKISDTLSLWVRATFLRDERDALRAELEAARKQEPYAEWKVFNKGGSGQFGQLVSNHPMHDGLKLYASPVQAQQSLFEEVGDVDVQGNRVACYCLSTSVLPQGKHTLYIKKPELEQKGSENEL